MIEVVSAALAAAFAAAVLRLLLQKHGESVELIGPKEFLCAAVSPPCARSLVQQLLQVCFDQPCKLLPNFLCLTLTPSNQIIHPAR